MTYHLLSALINIFAKIPFCIIYILSDLLFYIIYYIAQYRRKIVRKNLTESFPEKSTHEIRIIEKKFYKHFTDQALELIKLASISKKDIRRRMIFTNIEAINAQLREGKSISLFLGHYGNWEWASSLPLWLENNVIGAQIYHRLRNKSIDKIVQYIRGRMGASNVEMRKTAYFINKQSMARNVCLIGFISDQSPRIKDATHFLHFLNHNTPVLVGTEKVTKRYGYEAWFLHIKKKKRGYYEAEFIQMHQNPQSLPDFELTAIYYRLLEKTIKECPELYLWTHNRYKHATKLHS